MEKWSHSQNIGTMSELRSTPRDPPSYKMVVGYPFASLAFCSHGEVVSFSEHWYLSCENNSTAFLYLFWTSSLSSLRYLWTNLWHPSALLSSEPSDFAWPCQHLLYINRKRPLTSFEFETFLYWTSVEGTYRFVSRLRGKRIWVLIAARKLLSTVLTLLRFLEFFEGESTSTFKKALLLLFMYSSYPFLWKWCPNGLYCVWVISFRASPTHMSKMRWQREMVKIGKCRRPLKSNPDASFASIPAKCEGRSFTCRSYFFQKYYRWWLIKRVVWGFFLQVMSSIFLCVYKYILE